MARVNCYLPDATKQRFLDELGDEYSFSEVLRLGVHELLGDPVRKVPAGERSAADDAA